MRVAAAGTWPERGYTLLSSSTSPLESSTPISITSSRVVRPVVSVSSTTKPSRNSSSSQRCGSCWRLALPLPLSRSGRSLTGMCEPRRSGLTGLASPCASSAAPWRCGWEPRGQSASRNSRASLVLKRGSSSPLRCRNARTSPRRVRELAVSSARVRRSRGASPRSSYTVSRPSSDWL